MAHSPGPWKAVKAGSFGVTNNILDANGMLRAIDVGPPEDDARLIAAAPRMLELLRQVDQHCNCEAIGHTCPERQIAALLAEIDG